MSELPEIGKISPDIFDEMIYPALGKKDASVLVGPQHGVDIGVVDLGGFCKRSREKIMKKLISVIFLSGIFVLPLFGIMQIIVEPDKGSSMYDYTISNAEIQASKKKNLADILSGISDINISSKSFSSVLNDLSINGGTFEQTAVLFNGIKINDIQTGHFNLDIFVPSIGIGNLTILKNANSFMGAGAFSGLVNIESRKYEKDTYKAKASYGTYNTQYYGLSYFRKVSDFIIDLSAEKESSDGYHYDTDYYKNAAMLNLEYNKAYGLTLGFGEKAYGAYDFYTPLKNYASWEYIASKYISINILKNSPFSATVYYKSHFDKFILKRYTPAYPANKHNSAIYGAAANYEFTVNADNILNIKYGFQREEIQSSNLKNHYRNKHEVILNGFFTIQKMTNINLNAAVDKYDINSSYDFMPSAGVTYQLTDYFKLNGGYSTCVRYPNYTELYSNGSGNIGDAALKPEKSAEYSGGAVIDAAPIKASISTFYREASNLIEWGKSNISDINWKSKNIGRVNTAGFTASTGVDFDFLKLNASYTYLDSYESESFISKYGLIYLRHKLCASADFEALTIKVNTSYTFKSYINRKDAFNGLDITLSREFGGWLELSVKAENALNWYFEETPGIPACGRTLSCMVEMTF